MPACNSHLPSSRFCMDQEQAIQSKGQWQCYTAHRLGTRDVAEWGNFPSRSARGSHRQFTQVVSRMQRMRGKLVTIPSADRRVRSIVPVNLDVSRVVSRSISVL